MNHTGDSTLVKFSQELQRRPLEVVLFEGILFAILQFLAIAGNSLTLFVIWKSKNMRKTSNYFVACLAVSDLGMGVLLQPLFLTTLIMSRWPFNETVCQYQGTATLTLAAASIQTLAWMSINRYFRIVKTSHYFKIFTKKNLIATTVFIWLSSLLASSSYLLTGHRFVFHPAKFFCYFSLDVTWFIAVVTVYVGIPTIIIAFCYFKVFQTVRKHNSRRLSRKRGSLGVSEIKVTRTLFITVVAFMGCWTPVLIMDLIDTVRGTWSLSRSAYAAYTFLATVSFAVNPFIYTFSNPEFRVEFFKVLRCQKYSFEISSGEDVNMAGIRRMAGAGHCTQA